GGIGLVLLEVLFIEREQNFQLALARRAGQDFAEGEVKPLAGFAAAVFDDANRKGFCRFDVGGVVEQDKGLLGRVAAGAVDGAFLAAGGVEGEQAGVEERPLPVGVEAAAI